MSLFGVAYKKFDQIASMYGGFLSPVMKVAVNGNLLTLLLTGSPCGKEFLTDGVSVTLNRDSASGASFSIANCYDLSSRSFRRELDAGAKIRIMLGYGSKLETVFVGYVDTVSYEFSETPKASVTAFDAVKLMSESGSCERVWNGNVTYTRTISDIMKNYQDICPMPQANILLTLQKHGQLNQNSNNYDFIKNTLCKFCGRDLIVKAGKAYLINYKTQFGKLTDLEFGKGLTALSVQSGYKKVRAEVTGDKLADVHAKSTVSSGNPYKSSMNSPTLISKSAPFKTEKECLTYANRLAFDEISRIRTASGSCVGIPDIVPGVGLGFKGVDPQWNGKTYYVDSVTHTFSASGYTTSFTTRGWS